MAPVAYVAEDGDICHQWGERLLVLLRINAQVSQNASMVRCEWVQWCGNTLIEPGEWDGIG